MTTNGKEIDKPSNAKQMKDHFERLLKIKSRSPPIASARIRFMIMDVNELRGVSGVIFYVKNKLGFAFQERLGPT